MKVTFTTDWTVISLDVSLELTLGDLKAILEIEVDRRPEEMVLLHNLQPMGDEGKTLGGYNVEDGDVIQLTFPYIPPRPIDPPFVTQPPVAPSLVTQPPAAPSLMPQPPAAPPQALLPNIDWAAIRVPTSQQPLTQSVPPQGDPNDPAVIRRHFLDHPNELAVLRQQNPPLAQALESGDLELFRRTLENQVQSVKEEERRRIRILNADPLDPENQQLIAQDIQRKNIDENMQAAMEYTPESFSNIVMLYVLIKVNGVPVKAMVDSGAAGTIMSNECAQRCGVMRLVDRRFAGVAIGVGTQKIIGKVHLGTIQIGEDFLTSSFKVLEGQTEDMLLGLDMLRRHQCCIDLRKNVLRIGTTGNETPFLTEAELKDKEETRRKQALQIMEGEDAEMARAIVSSEKQGSQPGPSHQSSPPPPAAPVPPQGNAAIPEYESAVEQIVAAGFSRVEAITELRKADGNVQYALTALLDKPQ